VHFPVLALIAGAVRRFGRLERFRMVRQRKILIDDANFVAVNLLNLRESRTDSLTKRSLVIGEFHDRHRRRGFSAYRIVFRKGNAIARRVEHHLDAAARCLQLFDELRSRLLFALRFEEVLDLRAQIVERAALGALLVLLVEWRLTASCARN
jgi:hypothetical protein